MQLHAVEKYRKAILLMNGRPAKSGGHDVVKLRETVRALDKRIVFGPFFDPSIAGLHWRPCTVPAFLARLKICSGSVAGRGPWGWRTGGPPRYIDGGGR